MKTKATSLCFMTFKVIFLILTTNTGLCSGLRKNKESGSSNTTVIVVVIVAIVIFALVGIALFYAIFFRKKRSKDSKVGTTESVKTDMEIGGEKLEPANIVKGPNKADEKKKETEDFNEKKKSKSNSDSKKKQRPEDMSKNEKEVAQEDVKKEKAKPNSDTTRKQRATDASKNEREVAQEDVKKEKTKAKSLEDFITRPSSKSSATPSESSKSLPSATKRRKGLTPGPIKRHGTDEILPSTKLPSTIPTPGSRIA